MGRKLARLAGRTAFYLLLAVILLYTVFPFYWAIVSSLKTGSALFSVTPWPAAPVWDNYIAVFREQPFGRNILNSVVVATSTVLLSLALAVAAAYAMARIHFRGRRVLLFVVLGVSMFPQIAVLSGMFELVRALGLYNNLLALTFSYLIFTLPFTVWVLTTFMRELPRELEEAAIVDGAGYWRVYLNVILPLSRPILAALAVFFFLANWNSFLWPLTITTDRDLFVVQIGIASFRQQYASSQQLVMAASVIVAVPTMLLFILFQRQLVESIKTSGFK